MTDFEWDKAKRAANQEKHDSVRSIHFREEGTR